MGLVTIASLLLSLETDFREALRAIIRNEPQLRSICQEWYNANR